mmetsp:Transcript_5501/g.9588  ORF Transcript_5501/g.9588 Transcript_5501/m.9588 type:complete len:231 (+) Transcript_5501:68-760(+)
MEHAELNRFFQIRGVTPQVEFTNDNGLFQCKIAVKDVPHIGRGEAGTKKGAKEAAMHSFYTFLTRKNLIKSASDSVQVDECKIETAPLTSSPAKGERSSQPQPALTAKRGGLLVPKPGPKRPGLQVRGGKRKLVQPVQALGRKGQRRMRALFPTRRADAGLPQSVGSAVSDVQRAVPLPRMQQPRNETDLAALYAALTRMEPTAKAQLADLLHLSTHPDAAAVWAFLRLT